MSATIYPASYRFEPPPAAASLATRWLAIGLVASIAAIAGAFVSNAQFLRGYLIGYMLVLGFSLGAMALLMLGHLTGGNWWMIGRRVMEAAVGQSSAADHSLPAHLAGAAQPVCLAGPGLRRGASARWRPRPVISTTASGRCARSSIFAIWNLWAMALRGGSLQAGWRRFSAGLAEAEGVGRTGNPGLWPHHHAGRHRLDHVARPGLVLHHLRHVLHDQPNALHHGADDRDPLRAARVCAL